MENRPDQRAPSSLLRAIREQLNFASSPDQADIPSGALLADLKSTDWRRRVAALHLLAERGEPVPAEILRTLLSDEDLSVRAAAVHLLGHTPAPISVEPVIEALRDPDWLVRENALLALGELGAAGVPVPIKQLESHLDDAQEFVRESAQFALLRAKYEGGAWRKSSWLASVVTFIRRVRPVDISAQAEIVEAQLPDGEEPEPLITDLGSVRRLRSLPVQTRFTRAQRLFTGATAAVVVLSLIATWLLVLPRLRGTQTAQSAVPRVLFRATNLGNLYLPAWTDDSLSEQVHYSGGSTPYYGKVCNQSFTQQQICGDQHLSFVDAQGHLYTWDASTGKLAKKITLSQDTTLSKDAMANWRWIYPGRYIATHAAYSTGPNGSALTQIWDAVHGRQLFSTSTDLFDLTSDGRWMAAYVGQQKLLIVGSNEGIVRTLSSPDFAHLNSLTWSPDGAELATVSDDGTIQIWDAFSGTLLQTLSDLKDASPTGKLVYYLFTQWSPDGQRLATIRSLDASTALPVHIWDVHSGQLLQSYTQHTASLLDFEWLDGGQEMLSFSPNEALLWNTTTGKTLMKVGLTIPSGLYVKPLLVSPDEQLLAVLRGSTIQMMDLRTGRQLRSLFGEISPMAMAWSPASTYLATCNEEGQIQIWNAHTGQLLINYNLPAAASDGSWYAPELTWSPDGKMLAISSPGQGLVVLGTPVN